MTQRNTSGAERSSGGSDHDSHQDLASTRSDFDTGSTGGHFDETSARGASDPDAGFGAGIGGDPGSRRGADRSSADGREATGTIDRKRRRRGGRGRSRKADAEPESQASNEPAESEGESRPRRRSSRSRASQAVDEAPPSSEQAGQAAATDPGGEDDGPKRKRRRRGGRGRKRAGSERTEDDAVQADEPAGEGEGEVRSADAEAEDKPRRKRRRRRKADAGEERDEREDEVERAEDDDSSADDADGEGTGRKKIRRRRGTRGGRRSKSKSGGKGAAVALEVIPGEDDELTPERDELPELPDDAEELDAGRGKKKRRRRSRKRRGEEAESAEDDRGDEAEADESSSKRAKRTTRSKKTAVPNKILVNAGDREETRVAVVQDGCIHDFQMTVKKHQSLVNDIYRGKVVNLEPAIGAAFIDFGQGRNGFLHTSDVLTAYGEDDWSLDKLLTTKVDLDELDEDAQAALDEEGSDPDDSGDGAEDDELESKPRGRRKKAKKKTKRGKHAAKRGRSRHRPRPRLPISDLLKKGQSVVVQVTKDAIGDKGPTLTTYISIPGRFLVLMPSMARTGVSRKIEDEKERRRLKRILEGLEVPAGMGVIVRTAGVGATKTDLRRDLDYLLLLWDSFGKRLNLGRGPAPLYEESDVAIRTIRDLFDEGTEAVIVDDQTVFERVQEFTEKLMPEKLDLIQLHDGNRPLFHHFGVEQDFEKIFARRVDLPSGGSIVFDQTEALVAIDVNSGKTRTDGFDFEEIALKTNLDAVPEIARQIRLRDLGGIIVCDFIDMQKTSNRRAVERALRNSMASDRARSKLGRISQFGLLELTRQRLGPGMSKMLFQNCQHCRGSGKSRTVESKTAAILRRLGSALTLKGFSRVEVRAHPETIKYLKRSHSAELKALEAEHERELSLVEAPDQLEDCVLRYLRADGREVRPGGRRKR